MKVIFLNKFVKDLEKIDVDHVKVSIVKTIESVESADHLSEIVGIKKLKGFKSAFRIKIGDYRMGIYVDGNIVEMARVVHRKDIYKVFP